jgi:phosphopentomutase
MPAGSSVFNTGTRQGFVDIAASIAGWLGLKWQGAGTSFLAAQTTTA